MMSSSLAGLILLLLARGVSSETAPPKPKTQKPAAVDTISPKPAAAADSSTPAAADAPAQRSSSQPPTESAGVQGIRAAANDTLSGPLPGMLTANKSPYLVLADVYVPQGQTVIVEPGVVVLFAAFTGLKVQGTLLAKGASEKPIIFTSVNDQVHNPASTLKAAPYDWNGIQITEDGIGSHLAYCAVRYSVYGIASMTRYIRIGPTIFQENGRADLTIEGHEHEVGSGPYEYNMAIHAKQLPDSLIILRDPRAGPRAVLRYSGVGVLVVGAILSAVYTYRFSQSHDELDGLSAVDPQNLAANSSSDWEEAHDQARGDRAGMILGFAIGAVGAVGFGVSFAF
jgi:hypothetical protein